MGKYRAMLVVTHRNPRSAQVSEKGAYARLREGMALIRSVCQLPWTIPNERTRAWAVPHICVHTYVSSAIPSKIGAQSNDRAREDNLRMKGACKVIKAGLEHGK